ncbi:hypothetical protein AMJ86_09030, partial [bacterium SM23_57]
MIGILIEAKNRKVFQVAKELKIASPTILEFLDALGYPTNKRHMSPVTQEMYEQIIKKFDKNRWNHYQSQIQNIKEEKKRLRAEQLRHDELQKILEKKDKPLEKIELPKYAPPVVEVFTPPEEEVVEEETAQQEG